MLVRATRSEPAQWLSFRLCCRKAGRWTADDIEYLIQGVEKYQLSNWSLIRKTGLDGIFTGRTDVDLKVTSALVQEWSIWKHCRDTGAE